MSPVHRSTAKCQQLATATVRDAPPVDRSARPVGVTAAALNGVATERARTLLLPPALPRHAGDTAAAAAVGGRR